MTSNRQCSPEASDLYLIHDGTLDLPSLHDLAPEHRLIDPQRSERDTPSEGARVLLYLGDAHATCP
jgi:hypothetical protein